MLELLNILGYISLISVIYYIHVFLFSFDLTLQIINIVMVIAVILVNIFVKKKKHYPGIRILGILIIIALLSSIIYISYSYIKANMFFLDVEAIYDVNGNKIIDSNEIKSYSVRYVPDNDYMDSISKEIYEDGRITFVNLECVDVPIKYTVTISSFGTHPEHYTIIVNNMRYEFR